MKKILLSLYISLGLAASLCSYGQSFTTTTDTVRAFVGGAAVLHNDITNHTSGTLNLSWHVKITDFPNDWATPGALGLCDGNLCRGNTGDTLLWNVAMHVTGTTFTCGYSSGTTGTFDYTPDLSAATSPGTHYITVTVSDPASLYSKDITWVINKVPVAVPTVSNAVNDVSLYPNPAHDEVNIVYDESADIKNIAVYNIIGKVMSVYKVTSTSANLSLENIPSGVYFVRLINSKGGVVMTKKFTKQ
jgi:hypothetical protein